MTVIAAITAGISSAVMITTAVVGAVAGVVVGVTKAVMDFKEAQEMAKTMAAVASIQAGATNYASYMGYLGEKAWADAYILQAKSDERVSLKQLENQKRIQEENAWTIEWMNDNLLASERVNTIYIDMVAPHGSRIYEQRHDYGYN